MGKPEHGPSKGESGVPVVLVVAHRSQRVEHLEVSGLSDIIPIQYTSCV